MMKLNLNEWHGLYVKWNYQMNVGNNMIWLKTCNLGIKMS